MSPTAKNYLGTLCIALGLFIVMAMAWPQYNHIGQLRAAIGEREIILAERQSLIEKVKTLESEFKKRENDVQRFGSVIPAKKSSAEIVTAIENIATTSGMQLSGLIMANKDANETDPYESLTIEINLNGSYPSLVNFLAALEQNLRLMDVTSIEAGMAAVPSGQQALSFRVKVNAYFLK